VPEVPLERLLHGLVAEIGDGGGHGGAPGGSHHTVWFELHEELIRLTGRNRADEAAGGRG
jgi:hypothetical protein